MSSASFAAGLLQVRERLHGDFNGVDCGPHQVSKNLGFLGVEFFEEHGFAVVRNIRWQIRGSPRSRDDLLRPQRNGCC